MSDSSLSQKIVPARLAAQKAAANLKQNHSKQPRPLTAHVDGEIKGKPVHMRSEGDEEIDIDPPPGIRRRRGSGRGNSNTQTRLQTSLPRQPSKRSLNLSSTPSPKKPRRLSTPSVETPSKRHRPSIPSTPSSHNKTPYRSPSLSSLSSVSQHEYGTIYTEGDLVWVRINAEGCPIDPEMDVDLDGYWWPAQVIDDKNSQINVKLFGNNGLDADRVVSLSCPPSTVMFFRHEGRVRFSQDNFTSTSTTPEDSFYDIQRNTNTGSSDLAQRWKVAVDLALAACDDEDLPDPLALLDMTMQTKRRKPRMVGPSYEAPTQSQSPSRPRKASLDQDIKIGTEDGELVLAREHKDRLDHWPARVVGISQHKRTNNWLYEVCFMDGKKKKVDRTWFFSADEEGFATCQMGRWNTTIPASDTEGSDSEDEVRNCDTQRSSSPSPSESDLEVITDGDKFCKLHFTEQMRYVYPFLCRTIRREYQPSLERHDAFIKGGKEKEHLGLMASFRGELSENEVKKVSALVRKAMLRDERWAKRIHGEHGVRNGEEGEESVAESTMSYGTHLTTMMFDVPNQSEMPTQAATFEPPTTSSHPTMAEIAADLKRQTGARPYNSSAVSSSAEGFGDRQEHVQKQDRPSIARLRARPIGCTDYENLPRSERGLYCTDVLLPEAMLQLHLFRDGRRSSAHLLAPEEEAKLYAEGLNLLQREVHWLTQIVQLRQIAEKSLKRKKLQQSPMTIIQGGTSTRPKFLVT